MSDNYASPGTPAWHQQRTRRLSAEGDLAARILDTAHVACCCDDDWSGGHNGRQHQQGCPRYILNIIEALAAENERLREVIPAELPAPQRQLLGIRIAWYEASIRDANRDLLKEANRVSELEAENAALKAVPGDVAEAVEFVRGLCSHADNTWGEGQRPAERHIDTILAALNTRNEEIAALRKQVEAMSFKMRWLATPKDAAFMRRLEEYRREHILSIEDAYIALANHALLDDVLSRTATCPRTPE